MSELNRCPKCRIIPAKAGGCVNVSPCPMELLAKYIRYIQDVEGTDYIKSRGMFPSKEHFTSAEWEVLEELSKSAAP